jgi:hypothetical protein
MNAHTAKQQRIVDDWNARYRVGTPVTRYKLIHPLREPQETKTRSEAWLMGGHTAMVMVDCISGGVMVESLKLNPSAGEGG